MALYPNTLFHFTNCDAFHAILEGNFRLSYACESITGPMENKRIAIPMVSFCDLRLSELSKHIDSYGNYGIGLSKRWAVAKGLSPVFYSNSEARITGDVMSAVESLGLLREEIDIDSRDELNTARRWVLNVLRYMKDYDGTLVRADGIRVDNFRFADEREWRYVPNVNEPGVRAFYYLEDRPYRPERKKELNQNVKDHLLVFGPDDIKYLIVANDEERLPLIEFLHEAKGKNYPKEAINRLATRILTAKQVKEDM